MLMMESVSVFLSASPPIQNHPIALKATSSKANSRRIHFSFAKISSLQNHFSLLKNSLLRKTSVSFATVQLLISLPSLASETLPPTGQSSEKINLEKIVVSIDDFLNRNPFFVAGCTFIWLVVIPLTQQYFRKFKYVLAIDAFRKLRDNPEAQLLDIRGKKSILALGSPNFKTFNKIAVQVEFCEGDEEGFLKNVLEKFQDPANTILCILDNFDGNAMKVAELLFKNGFKEAYAIRGGVMGKKGWLAIQETLLPPSVHMRKKKKKKEAKVAQLGINGGLTQENDQNDASSFVGLPTEGNQRVDNGHLKKSIKSASHMQIDSRSPYPNYPDLKPPSSPTPSQP